MVDISERLLVTWAAMSHKVVEKVLEAAYDEIEQLRVDLERARAEKTQHGLGLMRFNQRAGRIITDLRGALKPLANARMIRIHDRNRIKRLLRKSLP